MPLRQTKYGGVCPLEKFSIDVPAGCGSYTNDPIEACLPCHWADHSIKGFDLSKLCKCPSDMDNKTYDQLKEDYCESKKPPYSSAEFREFALEKLAKKD